MSLGQVDVEHKGSALASSLDNHPVESLTPDDRRFPATHTVIVARSRCVGPGHRPRTRVPDQLAARTSTPDPILIDVGEVGAAVVIEVVGDAGVVVDEAGVPQAVQESGDGLADQVPARSEAALGIAVGDAGRGEPLDLIEEGMGLGNVPEGGGQCRPRGRGGRACEPVGEGSRGLAYEGCGGPEATVGEAVGDVVGGQPLDLAEEGVGAGDVVEGGRERRGEPRFARQPVGERGEGLAGDPPAWAEAPVGVALGDEPVGSPRDLVVEEV